MTQDPLRDDDAELAASLRAGRPEPRAFFREELSRRVRAAGPLRPRPEDLGLQISVWAAIGALLLVIALALS
jgi:hypothetical protein